MGECINTFPLRVFFVSHVAADDYGCADDDEVLDDILSFQGEGKEGFVVHNFRKEEEGQEGACHLQCEQEDANSNKWFEEEANADKHFPPSEDGNKEFRRKPVDSVCNEVLRRA